MSFRSLCACALSLLALSATAGDWETEVKVSADATETVDLSDARNARTHYFTLARGATLRVTNTSELTNKKMLFGIGMSESAGGAAYLDLTGVPGVQYTGNVKASGDNVKLVVKGVDALTFGTASEISATGNARNHSMFEGVIEFETSGGAGLQFVNGFALKNLPTCAYTIDPNAEMGLAASSVLSQEETTFALTDYNLLVASASAFVSNSTVQVADGRWCKFRPCGFGKPYGWGWGGSGTCVPLNVELQGPGAMIVNNNTQPGFTLVGDVSGTGGIYIESAAKYMTFDGELTFGGSLNLLQSSTAKEVFTTHTSFGDPTNQINNTCVGAKFALGIPLNGSAVRPAVTIGSIKATKYGILIVQDGQTATIGKLTTSANGFRVEAAEGASNAKVIVNELAEDAKLTVGSGVELVVGTAGAGHEIHFEGETVRFSGPATGERVALADYNWDAPAATRFIAGGKLDLGTPAVGFLPITIAAGADVAVSGALDFPIANAGGKVTLTDNAWQKKCYLWTDATKEASYTLSTEDTSKKYVEEWRDRRSGQAGFKFVPKKQVATEPFIEPEYLNKLDLMSCYGGSKCFMLVNSARSITNVPTAFAMMIYNGNRTATYNPGGGGFAVLANEDKVFQRSSQQTSAAGSDVPTQYPITELPFEGWLDGTAVTFTNQYFNKKGQLISLVAESNTVQGIGFRSGASLNGQPDGRGGQYYGEVLLFSEMPTDDERKRIEKYLADKWGLTITHAGAAATGTATGIAGAGEVIVESDNVVPALSHAFSGTLKFVNPLTETTTADLMVGNAGTDVTVTGFRYDDAQAAYVIDVALADKKIALGDYALLSGFPDGTRFVLGTVTNPHELAYALKVVDGTAYLTIVRKGMVLLVR